VQLKALRVAAGFTQEELATIAGLSVHAVSALERGQRRRPHVDTVRALSAALDLTGATRDALVMSARAAGPTAPVDELLDVSLPLAPTILLGRDADVQVLRLWLADPTARLITLTGPGGAGILSGAGERRGRIPCCSSGWPPFGTPRARARDAEVPGLATSRRSTCRSAHPPRRSSTLLMLDTSERY
jgi:transcriptional regulator with XRE-family HTH domain